MPNETTPLPNLSIEFLQWINAELRRRIEEPEEHGEDEGGQAGLVERLRSYLLRAS